MKKAFLVTSLVAGLAASSQAAVDLTAASTAITTDLTAAQGLALPIFATMFGITLVLAFFKKATH